MQRDLTLRGLKKCHSITNKPAPIVLDARRRRVEPIQAEAFSRSSQAVTTKVQRANIELSRDVRAVDK